MFSLNENRREVACAGHFKQKVWHMPPPGCSLLQWHSALRKKLVGHALEDSPRKNDEVSDTHLCSSLACITRHTPCQNVDDGGRAPLMSIGLAFGTRASGEILRDHATSGCPLATEIISKAPFKFATEWLSRHTISRKRALLWGCYYIQCQWRFLKLELSQIRISTQWSFISLLFSLLFRQWNTRIIAAGVIAQATASRSAPILSSSHTSCANIIAFEERPQASKWNNLSLCNIADVSDTTYKIHLKSNSKTKHKQD